jgi:hypothetical protein
MVGGPLLAGEDPASPKEDKAMKADHPDMAKMHEQHMAKLDEAIKAVDAANAAVQADNKQQALVELKKAHGLLTESRKAMQEQFEKMHGGQDGKVANMRCPIRGTKIDPKAVPASLTRTFDGKKVGFCCPGCPAAWDKLSDEQKAAKLQASLSDKEPMKAPAEKMMHEMPEKKPAAGG